MNIGLVLASVGHRYLGRVAHAVVDLAACFPTVRGALIQIFVVVAAVSRRINIGRRIKLQQCRRIRIKHRCRNLACREGDAAAGSRRIGRRARCRGCSAVVVFHCLRKRIQVSRSKVTCLHLVGRHKVFVQSAGRLLVHVLITGPEEQFVAIVVELRKGQQHRAADVATRIVLVVLGLASPMASLVGVFRIEDSITSIEIAFAMELCAAVLAEGLEHDRTFGIFTAIRRHEYFHFGRHVLVNVGKLRSCITWVDQIGAIQQIGYRAVRLRTVGGGGTSRSGTGRGDTVIKAGALSKAIVQSHARHDFYQFACITSRDRVIRHM